MKLVFTDQDAHTLATARTMFGQPNESNMAKEECSETITAICHFDRHRATIDSVVDEFADAIVCVGQLIYSEQGSIDGLNDAIGRSLNKLQDKLARRDCNFSKNRQP